MLLLSYEATSNDMPPIYNELEDPLKKFSQPLELLAVVSLNQRILLVKKLFHRS